MNLSQETTKELILTLLGVREEEKKEGCPWVTGKNYHVRTVTMDIAGKLKAICKDELVFEGAAWIADSGRFNEYLKDTSKVNESEPYKYDVILNRKSITDATEIDSVYTEVR